MSLSYEEEQDFKVLEALIKANVGFVSFSGISKVISPIVGGGEWEIVKSMVDRGLMSNGFLTMDSKYNDGFGVTQAGETKYLSLRKRIKNNKRKSIAFWILFVASLIAGIDVLVKWFSPTQPFKNEKQQLPTQSQTPPTSPIQSLKPDTIKVHDTTKKKDKPL